MSLGLDHQQTMKALEKIQKEIREKKSTTFLELLIASLSGAFASKLLDIIYTLVIQGSINVTIGGLLFVFLFVGLTGFLWTIGHWTDIVPYIRNKTKRQKKTTTEKKRKK